MTQYKKTSIFLILLSIITLCIITCNKQELGHQDFPRIKTTAVSMVSDTGAQFTGEIIDIPEDCEIIDYGFVWGPKKDVTINQEKISLGNIPTTGPISCFANYGMVEGNECFFKSFLQTSTLIVYGNELSFISSGSHAPIILSVSPDSGSWLDTVTITGKYFSSNPNNIQVFFNSSSVPKIINEYSVTQIKVIVPTSITTTYNTVSIKFGSIIYPSDKIFKLIPKVKSTTRNPLTDPRNTANQNKQDELIMNDYKFISGVDATIDIRTNSLIQVEVLYNN